MLKESRAEQIKLLVTTLAMLMSISVSLFQQHEEKQLKKESQIYEVQLERLTQVQASINNLSDFVSQQKEQLKQSQQAVDSLKKEQESLKPVVEADRQVVDSILRLQAERASANVWQERFIGFGLGIASSLVASLIWAGIKRGRNA